MTDIFAGLICRPPRKQYDEEDLGAPHYMLQEQMCIRRDLELRTRSKMTIKCSHYLPVHSDTLTVESPVPCVVYLHGNSGSRMDADDIVDPFLAEKISVFSIDFSGCGLSDGEFVTLGWRERGDLEAVLDYLATVPELVSHVALYGRSMGAATAMLVASDDRFYHRVVGMVLDSCYSSVRQMLCELAGKYVGKVPLVPVNSMIDPAVDMLRQAVKNRAGFDINKIDVLEAARHCNAPVLFGHASGDELVLVSHTRRLYADYGGPKELNIFEGDHNSIRPQDFRDQALRFLHKCFVDARAASSACDMEEAVEDQGVFARMATHAASQLSDSTHDSSTGAGNGGAHEQGGLWSLFSGGGDGSRGGVADKEKDMDQTGGGATNASTSTSWQEQIRTDDFMSAPKKVAHEVSPDRTRNFLGGWSLLAGWGPSGKSSSTTTTTTTTTNNNNINNNKANKQHSPKAHSSTTTATSTAKFTPLASPPARGYSQGVEEDGDKLAEAAGKASSKGGQSNTKGSLGLLLTAVNGQVQVTSIAPGGAASRDGGVQVGDRIVSIDRISAAGLSISNITDLIRGTNDTMNRPVEIQLLRKASGGRDDTILHVALPRPTAAGGGGGGEAKVEPEGEARGAQGGKAGEGDMEVYKTQTQTDEQAGGVSGSAQNAAWRGGGSAAAAAAGSPPLRVSSLAAMDNKALCRPSAPKLPPDDGEQQQQQHTEGKGVGGSCNPEREARRAEKRKQKECKAWAKLLCKLRSEGVVQDRSSIKAATIVSTLVPFDGKPARHHKRPVAITSSVRSAAPCDGTCNAQAGRGCTCPGGQGEWVVQTIVKHAVNDHLDWFWQRAGLVALGCDMFPNVKEISESTAAYRTALRYMQEHSVPCQTRGAVDVVCVADGATPRTAALFAAMLPQLVHSVDPAMHARYVAEEHVPHALLAPGTKGVVAAHACTIEQWLGKMPRAGRALECVCIVAVHSHVLLEDYVPHIRTHYSHCRVILLAVPCCVEQRLCPPPGAPTSKGLHPSLQPTLELCDMGIHSHDRTVRVWDLPAVDSLRRAVVDMRLSVSMRTHTDKAIKGNYMTQGGRHRLISDMYGQHH